MALNNEQTVDKLNYILGTLRDGEKGYRDAADEVTNSEYQTMFNQYAQQRSTFAAQIEAEIRQLGGDPRDGGSAGAALHRAWTDVRDAITGKDDAAVIAEVERGEDVAIDNYQDVMEESLPADIKGIITQQYDDVKAAHDRIRDLKNATQ